MRHSAVVCAVALSGVVLVGAPVPQDARVIVAGLSDPSGKVRDEAVAALTNRPDAAPWLRRAARSPDRDTADRAAKLLAGYSKKQQEVAKQALDACIRSHQADLFVEWHHFWQPESKGELWPVGPRMGEAAVDLYAGRFPKWKPTAIEKLIDEYRGMRREDFYNYDGSFVKFFDSLKDRPNVEDGPWRFRTDQLRFNWGWSRDIFASVAGPISMWECMGGYHFALGDANARVLSQAVIVCDGDLGGREDEQDGIVRGPGIRGSVVICRGNAMIPRAPIEHSILLVDGDINLSESRGLEHSLIRASGEIRMPTVKDVSVTGALFEAHAKNATAPYKFFELSDVGLSLVDDEEGLVVAEVKPGTPFGNSGLAKGDVIQMIDDARAGHSELFRKQVRRAMVVQGDCLLTVARGRETHDIAVRFPLPK